MIRLGIVGAQNSHSYSIGKICNTDKAVPMRVAAIWGETAEFAQSAATNGAIPKIVQDWRELLGQVDVVMVDHRHAQYHFEPAEFFIRKGVPTFIDKPMTATVDEARRLLDLAESGNVPVTTFSAIAIQPAFQAFKSELAKDGTLRTLNSTGPVDLESPYGGIFFYGIHQVDAMVELMGTEAESVTVERRGVNAIVIVRYSGNRWATINCLAGPAAFHWMACTERQVLTCADVLGGSPYLPSAQLILRLVEEKRSCFSRERMLAPVAILAAMESSLQSGKTVNVQLS
jgi:predicted dehydrogenase